MTGSCPVSALVCRETARERDQLRRWKTEALPVLDGLQELGKALGLPLGSRITGPEALAAVERLRAIESGIEALTRTGYDHTPDCVQEQERADSFGETFWHPDCGRCWEDSLHILLDPTEGEDDE